MLFVVSQRRQAGHQFPPIGGPQDGTVPSYPPQAEQCGCHLGGRIMIGAESVDVVENRLGILGDQLLVMRRQQHRHAAVRQGLCQHHATSGSETMT